MLRTRLLTATAAVALFSAPAAFAQTAMPAEQQTAPAAAMPAPAAAQTPEAATPAATGNVIDTLKADGQFTTLLAALDAAQLTQTLSTQSAISIFAPTDAAFAKLSEAERTRLMDPANVNDLRQLLLYHVIVADVQSSQIEGTKGGVETAARTQVQLDGTQGGIKIDNATVTRADIDASNGAIFAIDSVLNPGASAVASGDAEEAEAAPAATDAAPAATPPAAATTDEAMTEDATEATPPAEDVTPPAETATPPAPTPPVEPDADADDAVTPPASTSTPAPTPTPTPEA